VLAKTQSDLKKILIIRNDKLGDFMLTSPSLALLKENLPDFIHVDVLQQHCAGKH